MKFGKWNKLGAFKEKISSLTLSLKDDYVDSSKEILDEILKGNDCEVPSDDNEVMECVETKKEQN